MTGYPWSHGDTLTAADLNAAIANMGGPSGVTPGSYTNANISIDAHGRITAASSGSAAGTGTVTSVASGTGLTGGPITTAGTISMAPSGVSAATYGDATHVPQIAVDATGRITSASSVLISGGGSGTVTSIAAGTGLSASPGSPITTTGTLSAQWSAGAVSALSGGLAVASGTLSVGTLGYSQLPTEVQQVPISFPFAGKPGAGAVVNVPMVMSLVVPASLAGTTVYDTTQTTANAVFTLNRITGGTTITAIGTITVTSTSHTSCTLSGTGATLGATDVMQIVAPGTQDGSLADIGITILCNRV